MLEKLNKVFNDLGDELKKQSGNIGEGARHKTEKILDEWLQIFPKLEIYGLSISSFSLAVAISPSVEVELVGDHEKFSQDRLQSIIDANKTSTALTTVLTTIKTAYSLHRRTYADLKDPLIVKIKIKISPEVRVFIGQPYVVWVNILFYASTPSYCFPCLIDFWLLQLPRY